MRKKEENRSKKAPPVPRWTMRTIHSLSRPTSLPPHLYETLKQRQPLETKEVERLLDHKGTAFRQAPEDNQADIEELRFLWQPRPRDADELPRWKAAHRDFKVVLHQACQEERALEILLSIKLSIKTSLARYQPLTMQIPRLERQEAGDYCFVPPLQPPREHLVLSTIVYLQAMKKHPPLDEPSEQLLYHYLDLQNLPEEKLKQYLNHLCQKASLGHLVTRLLNTRLAPCILLAPNVHDLFEASSENPEYLHVKDMVYAINEIPCNLSLKLPHRPLVNIFSYLCPPSVIEGRAKNFLNSLLIAKCTLAKNIKRNSEEKKSASNIDCNQGDSRKNALVEVTEIMKEHSVKHWQLSQLTKSPDDYPDEPLMQKQTAHFCP